MENQFKLKGNGDKLSKFAEKGLYQDAAEKNVTFGEHIENLIETPEAGGFEPTIYKGMSPLDKYRTKKEYYDRRETPPPDAYEMMLERMQILEGIARGERAILENRVHTHAEAKRKMKKWLI